MGAERELESSLSSFEEGLIIAKDLSVKTEGIGIKKLVCEFLENIGELYFEMGSEAKALNKINSAFEIREKLLDPDDIQNLAGYIGARLKMANRFRKKGKIKEAFEISSTSLSLGQEMFQTYSSIPSVTQLKSAFLFMLGDCKKLDMRLDESVPFYFEKLALDRSIADQLNNTECNRNVCLTLGMLGEVKNAQESYQKAKLYYQEAISISKGIIDAEGHSVKTVDQKVFLLLSTGLIRSTIKLNHQSDETIRLKSAFELYEEIKGYCNDLDDLRDLWWTKGLVYAAVDNQPLAEEAFKQAIKHSTELLKEVNTPYHQSLHDKLLADQERSFGADV